MYKINKYKSRNRLVREGRGLLQDQEKVQQMPLLPSSPVALGVVILLTVADVATLKNLFNAVLIENPKMVWILAATTALILDASLSVVGNCLRQYQKKLRSKSSMLMIAAACSAAFLITLLFCMNLRMQTRELTFTGVGAAQSGLVDLAGGSGTETADTSGSVLAIALLMSFLPVATSLLAFGVSYATSNPRQEKLQKLRIQRRQLQEFIANTEAFFAEYGDMETDWQIQQEELQYRIFLESIRSQVLQAKRSARMLLMERTGTPDAITALSEASETAGLPSEPPPLLPAQTEPSAS